MFCCCPYFLPFWIHTCIIFFISFFYFQTEKFQAGFEFEANKLDVPDSMLPRNFNARLQVNVLGYKMNALEVIVSCFISLNHFYGRFYARASV